MRCLALTLAAGALLCIGCSGAGADPSSGPQALFRIQGAQYIAGPIDTSDRDPAPVVSNISIANNSLFPGVANKKMSGSVGPNSTAVLVGLQGDVGHWVVPVQDPDAITVGNYTFSFSASFSPLTPAGDAGNLLLAFRAITRDGQVGPALSQPMIMDQPHITGSLVISLDWDTEADLDLHVQLPSDGDAGVNEIWSRKPSGLPFGSAGASVDAGMQAGYLDFDSNCMCVIDGRRLENVIFLSVAPNGRYIVRVDTFSLCAEATARWRVRVFENDGVDPVLQAFGQSTDIDTRFPHGQGAGLQALVFDN
jgi:hypothetical protein